MTRIAAILLAAATLSGCIFHDRRSFGSVIDDQNLELSIIDSINRDKELALKNHVEVVVYNGVVLLIGRTSTAELSARAEQVAMGYQGVRRVVNEIEVGPRIDVGDTTSDKVLSTRVKTGLADIVGIKGFDPTRVNVTTEAGVVYLMGLVTQEEAERVVEIARATPGVQRVVRVFEYTD
jgi:osmotically-inducible protein OsmY